MAGLRQALVADRDELLPVDGIVEGVAELGVPEYGVAERARLVVAVELKVVPVVEDVGDSLEAAGDPSGLNWAAGTPQAPSMRPLLKSVTMVSAF